MAISMIFTIVTDAFSPEERYGSSLVLCDVHKYISLQSRPSVGVRRCFS